MMINPNSSLQSKTTQQLPYANNNNNNAIYYEEENAYKLFDTNENVSSTQQQSRKKKQRRHQTNTPALRRQSYIVKKKTMNTKFKKPKKSVMFQVIDSSKADNHDGRVQSGSVSKEEIQKLWYNKSELKDFRQQTLQLVVRYNRQQLMNKNNGKGANNRRLSIPRGMGLLSKKRRRHKGAALKYVLLASKKGKSSAFIAKLSAKLSSWNTDIAIHDARKDFFSAYQPHLLHTVPPVSSKPPQIPFFKSSQTRSSNNNVSRVRRRRSLHTPPPFLVDNMSSTSSNVPLPEPLRK